MHLKICPQHCKKNALLTKQLSNDMQILRSIEVCLVKRVDSDPNKVTLTLVPLNKTVGMQSLDELVRDGYHYPHSLTDETPLWTNCHLNPPKINVISKLFSV